jgi:hypothetical protein
MQSPPDLQAVLTEIASKIIQSPTGFVGLGLFPLFRTTKPSSGYWVIDDTSFVDVHPTIIRAPGSSYARSITKLGSDKYNCELYGHEEPVGDEESQKYARPGAALEAATRRGMNIILLAHELRVHDLATSATVPSAVVAIPWNDPASDPLGDVNAARKGVFYGCLQEANVMTISRTVFDTLKHHPEIKDVIKISDNDARWPQLLAAYFDVDRLLVARGIVNTANEGQAVNLSEIWGEDVILAHVDDNPDGDLKTPSFGRTFAVVDENEKPQGVKVSYYNQTKLKSTIVRADAWTDEKIAAPNGGFRLANVLG